jgi:hypothetical protein
MCWASCSIFSLLGSVRSDSAASATSSATCGFTASWASSRLRKSSGDFRNEGSSLSFFWLILAPSPGCLHHIVTLSLAGVHNALDHGRRRRKSSEHGPQLHIKRFRKSSGIPCIQWLITTRPTETPPCNQ